MRSWVLENGNGNGMLPISGVLFRLGSPLRLVQLLLICAWWSAAMNGLLVLTYLSMTYASRIALVVSLKLFCFQYSMFPSFSLPGSYGKHGRDRKFFVRPAKEVKRVVNIEGGVKPSVEIWVLMVVPLKLSVCASIAGFNHVLCSRKSSENNMIRVWAREQGQDQRANPTDPR